MISLFKIHTPEDIGKTVQEVFDSGFITEGTYSDRFEQEFGAYIGNPNAVLVNSCTSAIHLAAVVSNVGPGTEVITSAMTCMAGNEPFYNLGATLVFADVEPDTGNIDVADIERKITDRTVAISGVHWAGNPMNVRKLNELAEKYNLRIIEDAAHAVNTRVAGEKIGNFSDFSCFSFQAVKHLTTVDGGAILCKSAEDAARLRKLRWFGLDRGFKAPPGQPPASRWEQDIKESGYKMHMNNVNAAIGLRQLEYIDALVDRHIENGKYYDAHISNPAVKTLQSGKYGESSYWIYSVLVEDRRHFKAYLEAHEIASDVVHVRNDQYTVFEPFRTDLPGLDYFESRLMNIPVGWWVSDEERAYIVDMINEYQHVEVASFEAAEAELVSA